MTVSQTLAGTCSPTAGSVATQSSVGIDLLQNLVSWWELGEASGDRVDSHGSNDLSDISLVGQNTGKVGDCADFDAATADRLEVAAPHGLEGGARDWSVACWIYPTGSVASRDICGTGLITQGAFWYDWKLITSNASKKVGFHTSDSSTTRTIWSDDFGALSINTWYFVYGCHDESASTNTISVNAGFLDSLGSVESPQDAAQDFIVGQMQSTFDWSGRIDQLGFWNRVLNEDEVSALYNGGAGVAYADFS